MTIKNMTRVLGMSVFLVGAYAQAEPGPHHGMHVPPPCHEYVESKCPSGGDAKSCLADAKDLPAACSAALAEQAKFETDCGATKKAFWAANKPSNPSADEEGEAKPDHKKFHEMHKKEMAYLLANGSAACKADVTAMEAKMKNRKAPPSND